MKKNRMEYNNKYQGNSKADNNWNMHITCIYISITTVVKPMVPTHDMSFPVYWGQLHDQ